MYRCTFYGSSVLVILRPDPSKRLSAIFYRTEAGNEPVREWLKSLPRDDKKRIGADILTVELGWPIGMPVCVRRVAGSMRFAPAWPRTELRE